MGAKWKWEKVVKWKDTLLEVVDIAHSVQMMFIFFLCALETCVVLKTNITLMNSI